MITFHKANQLGLEGKHVNLSVTKVGGRSEQINSNKYELTLKDKKILEGNGFRWTTASARPAVDPGTVHSEAEH